MIRKTKILLLGALPPPWEGMAVANKNVLESELIDTKFNVLHYNTKINFKFSSIGKFSMVKLFRILRLYLVFPVYLINHQAEIIYMPLSGSKNGILRDILFIQIAKICFGLKIVIHYHASYYDKLFKDGYFFKKIVKLTLGIVDKHIVLCEKLKEMLSCLQIPSERISVVRNGIRNDPRIFMKVEKEMGFYKILYFSHLVPEKGCFDVLKSIPYLLERIKNGKNNIRIVFIFVGAFKSSKHRILFNNFINTHRLNNYVKIYGVLSDRNKLRIYEKSDIFVFPSYSEGQPFVLIEAMKCGLPVIVTKVGCMSKMVKEEINGYFVPPGAPELIADRVFALINDPKLTKRMGKENRKLFEKEYSYKIFELNMVRVFQGVLES